MPNDHPDDSQASAGALFIVSTPIGNLGDISPRAIETLRSADLILCEDTRHSRRLLDAVEVRTRVASLHEHNEAREIPRLLARLAAGQKLALISDAGTPLISDPGSRLVKACAAAGVAVVPVPGASAVLAAVVVSGLVDGAFTFFGFLPRKGAERRAALADLSNSSRPGVLYEAGNRVVATLDDLAAGGKSDRQIAVCRELTKRFEEVRRGTVTEVAAYYRKSPPRGEVVIVMAGAEPVGEPPELALALARKLQEEGRTTRDVAKALVDALGLSRNAAYAMARNAAETREARTT